MMAPISVKGQQAHPFFQSLAEKSTEPKWNFSKYLISADRVNVQYFPTIVSPESDQLRSAIEALL